MVVICENASKEENIIDFKIKEKEVKSSEKDEVKKEV